MRIKRIVAALAEHVSLILVAGPIGLTPCAGADTIVTANGFPELQPVDSFGNVTVVGHHSAVLNLVTPEDANKSWTLEGELYKCSVIPFRLSTKCNVSGSTSSNLFLTCQTADTLPCESLSNGVRAATDAAVVNAPDVTDHDSSSCVTPACPGGGGCPDPPPGHGPPPRIEISGEAEKGGDMPLILAIPGQGAFAENHLARLYDDGLGVDTDHRLAFVTMPSGVAKEPRRVYSTPELPRVFEAQYGDIETTIAGDRVEDEHVQEFFTIKGAYAVINLGQGRQLGLVDQIHNEDWYVDLKQYVSRYRHPGGAPGLSTSLWDPVTLRLASVFIWDGSAWVNDPLQVLEALSDSFAPSAEEWERLRSAVR